MADFDFWKNEFVDAARFAFGLRLLIMILVIAVGLFFALVLKSEVDIFYRVVISAILLPTIAYAYAGYRAVSKFKFPPIKATLAVIAGAFFAAAVLSWKGDLTGYIVNLTLESLLGAIFGFVGALIGSYMKK